MRRKIALSVYSLIGLVNLVMGSIYFTSDEFLTYHSQAVGASWEEVDPGAQSLILALMKVAGGGWFALGFFTIAIALSEWKRRGTLAGWALPAGTLFFYLPTLAATWSVYRETGAQSPWAPSLAIIMLTLVAMVIHLPWPTHSPAKDS